MLPLSFIFAFQVDLSGQLRFGNGILGWSPTVPGIFNGEMPTMFFTAVQWNAYLGILCSLVILPTVAATYYQAFKARKEAREWREGIHSLNCLEFVVADGSCINLIPLETLHTLPKPGDIVLLPGDGVSGDARFSPGAYRIERMEHIYTPAESKLKRLREARLTKAVALVTSLH
jgi:hypothetical protein